MLLCSIALLLSTAVSAQDSKENFYGLGNRVGVGIGAGTEGIGIDASVSLTKWCSARLGLNIMPDFNVKADMDVESSMINGNLPDAIATIEGKASLSRTYVDLKFDFYPFPNSSSFFLCGGFSMGGSEVITVNAHSDEIRDYIAMGRDYNVMIGDYKLPIDENGDANGEVKVNGFRPYLGLGFGRLIPKNRVGFRFEIGAQFQGKPKIYAGGENLEKQLDQETKDDISKVLDYMKVYPVLKLSLRGRIL